MLVRMTRKYHNHSPQTHQQHYVEEAQNYSCHTTAITQFEISIFIFFSQMIANADSALQNKDLMLCLRSYFTSIVDRNFIRLNTFNHCWLHNLYEKFCYYSSFYHLCELPVAMFLYYYISTMMRCVFLLMCLFLVQNQPAH